MQECKASFYKRNIKYEIYGTGLPILTAGLRHLMDRTTNGLRDLERVRQVNYVVDVGANMGYLSIAYHFAFPNAQILAIEPSTHNFQYLSKNVENIPNIKALQAAVASKDCVLEIALPTKDQRGDIKILHQEWDNTGAISVFGKTDLYRESVNGVKLDDVVTRKVDVMKLDIEGYELEALKGAHRILSEDKPALQVEMRPQTLAMAGLEPHDLHLFILGYGYLRTGRYQADLIYVHKDYIIRK